MRKIGETERAYLKKRGDLIYTYRLEKGLSQARMAQELNINQSVISNAERGLFKKSQDKVILLIQKKFNVDANLFAVKSKKENEGLSPATKEILEKIPPQYFEPIEKYIDENMAKMRKTTKDFEALLESQHKDYGKLLELNSQYIKSINKSFRAYIKIRKYIEETPPNELDKEKLLKVVNELGEILYENY